MRQDDSLVVDFITLLAREWNSSATKCNGKGVFVDDFVVALSQLTMNLHAKTDELKNFFLVDQFRHKLLQTRISPIHTSFRHDHEFASGSTQPDSVSFDIRDNLCNSCGTLQ